MVSSKVLLGVSGTALLALACSVSAKSGDFNGDGFDDLVVGVDAEDVDGQENAGAVHVLYGSASGVRAQGDQFWHHDVNGIQGDATVSAYFGNALAVGDFDDDGFDDLAIGANGFDVDGINRAGAVHVLFGSSQGLRATSDQLWHQDVPGIKDDAEEGDYFGSELAAGDFDGDGFDDLAIAADGEDIDGIDFAGAVHVLFGSSHGLRATGDQFWHQNSPGIKDQAEEQDFFGWSLTVGDFDGDGRDDLAIGVPDEDIGGVPNAGAVNVLYGSNSGLTASGDQFWHQNVAGVKDTCEEEDFVGDMLAAGDFDGDGRDDLAMGIEEEDFELVQDAGAVAILYGSGSGLTANGDQFFTQETPGIPTSAGDDEDFGGALAVGDFDNDGRDDLAVAADDEVVDGFNDAGAVHVFYGSSSGLRVTGDQLWHQDVPGIANAIEDVQESFGEALGSGDFDGDGRDDLVIGVDFEWIDDVQSAGAVHIIYGTISGLKAIGDQFWHQDVAGVADGCDTFDRFGREFP